MTARKNIPNASSYEIDPDGFVYHKDNRLQLQRRGKCWIAQIYTDSGHRQNINSERLARSMFHDPDPMLTYDDIMNNFKTRPVDDFPRYVVTAYGAVYCIDPPKRGQNAGSCYLVHETLKRGRAFVTLRNHGGMRKLLKVENVVKKAWEY